MLAYREGDLAAFELLYARFQGPLYRYLMSSCGDAQLASELFQDIWAAVIRVRASYQPRARFATWLFRLAQNRLIDAHRRKRAFSDELDEHPGLRAPEHEQPEARLEAELRGRRLLSALQALPPEQRGAFLMKEEGGLSLEEIAQATGVGRETVKSRLRYALARLREVLADVR